MTRAPDLRTLTSDDGRRIAFKVIGTGRPNLLFIHGWACHQGFWDRQAATPQPHATLVTLNLCGHGGSSAPDSPRSLSMAGLARDVVAVVDALSLPEVILVGHSMGGPVAIEAAIQMPDRCRLVIGVETFTDAAFYRRRPRAEIAARCQAFAADFGGAINDMVRRITLSGGPDLATWIAREMSRPDPTTALVTLEALLEWDIATRWPALPCAVETINSAVLSRGIETVQGLDGLRVHLMDRVGHFPMLEDPTGFLARLRDVLGRTLRPASPSCWS